MTEAWHPDEPAENRRSELEAHRKSSEFESTSDAEIPASVRLHNLMRQNFLDLEENFEAESFFELGAMHHEASAPKYFQLISIVFECFAFHLSSYCFALEMSSQL